MRLVLYIIFTIYCVPAMEQSFPSLVFSRLTEKNGLSNNDVKWIIQDTRGFIWAGTHDGLNRLDGYRVKKFFHFPYDNNSLINNHVVQLINGTGHNIWISTAEGISCYNTQLNTFTNFPRLSSGHDSLIPDYGRGLFFDSLKKQVWISVRGYLYSFSEDLSYAAYPAAAGELSVSFKNMLHYNGMYEDSRHQWWVYFANWIFKIDRASKKVTESFHFPSADVRALFEDATHHYWVATFGDGMFSFDPQKKTMIPLRLSGDRKFLNSLCEWKDKNGHSWIVAGGNNGLLLIDPLTLQSKIYTPDVIDGSSLTQGDINCLFTDRENILWIGTTNGISYIEPSLQKIEVWDIISREERIAEGSEDFVYDFAEDGDQYLASCWSRDYLLRFDRQGNMTMKIKKKPPDKIFGLLKTKQGELLMTSQCGVIQSSKDKHSSYSICKETGEEGAGSLPGLRTISQYDDSTFWIRTRNNGANGIYVYNSHLKKVIAHYASFLDCTDCLPPKLQDLIITRSKEIFVSPEGHYLYQFDKQRNKFIPFFRSDKETAAIPSKTFNCLAEDANGHLWVGTGNGLFEMDVKSRKIINDFANDRKLGGIAIEALCFDDDNNLWMNTERGLFCVTSQLHEVYNFHTGDGLPDNSLPGFLYRGSHGYMYSGGVGYILKFRPSEILGRRQAVDVQLSEVTIMNRVSPVLSDNNSEMRILLNPGENLFTVDYSVVNYDNAAGNRYFYKLDGIMKEWKENQDGHLSFFNLPAGKHLLHVKGSDRYGNFSGKEKTISVIVTPYWWQTNWFLLTLAILAGILIYLTVSLRIRSIKRHSAIRAKIAETEMMALRAQMSPHFIFNCLSIVDGLIAGNRKDEAKDFLQKFSKLIRMTLENSQQQLVPLESDLKTLKLYTELESVRYNHSFSCSFEVEDDLLQETIKIPPLLLQPYVENAIVHGLRNKEDRKGFLRVSIKKCFEGLDVVIEDNGIGRIRSREINAVNQRIQKHLGMEVTGKRIELLKTISSNKISIDVIDIDEAGNTGTRIHLLLPLHYNIESKN